MEYEAFLRHLKRNLSLHFRRNNAMRPQAPRGLVGNSGGGAHGHFSAFPIFEQPRGSSSGSFWDRMPSRASATHQSYNMGHNQCQHCGE
eukprot:7169789-Pyramimonas_sp.AAC.1